MDKSVAEGQEPEEEEGQTGAPDLEKYVPKEEYEQLLVEASTSKEKAELLDQLLADPEFQAYLDHKEEPEKAPRVPPPPKTGVKTPDLVAQLEKVIEPLRNDIETMKKVYYEDQEKVWAVEADRQIAAMASNKEEFPFFLEVQAEMAKLLESGRASSMVDAYRLCTYDKARASGRAEVLDKTKKRPVLLPSPDRRSDGEPKSAKGVLQQKRSLRDIISDAFDQHNIDIPESDEED